MLKNREKQNFLKIIDILEEIVALGEEIEADLAEKAKDPTSGVTAEDVFISGTIFVSWLKHSGQSEKGYEHCKSSSFA